VAAERPLARSVRRLFVLKLLRKIKRLSPPH
jgi:hypothetical protein